MSLKFIPLLLQFRNLSSQILYEMQWRKGFVGGTNISQQSSTYMCIHFMKYCANTSVPKGTVIHVHAEWLSLQLSDAMEISWQKLTKLHSYNYILDRNCNQSSTTLCVTWPITVYKSYKQILHMRLNCYLFNCDHFIILFSTEVKGLFFLASEVVNMKGHHKAFCTNLFVPKCTKQIKQNHKANNSGKWSARHVFMVWSLVSRLHID